MFIVGACLAELNTGNNGEKASIVHEYDAKAL